MAGGAAHPAILVDVATEQGAADLQFISAGAVTEKNIGGNLFAAREPSKLSVGELLSLGR
jgi:hypothetical protein